jgi:hypothetical protein
MQLTHLRLTGALKAGTIAIGINTMLLALADRMGIHTAHGGLLRLLVIAVHGSSYHPWSPAVGYGFHIIVGLFMALAYAAIVEPALPGPAWVRGLFYGAAVYGTHLLVTLHEGIVTHHVATPTGLAWSAGAHLVYFIVLAILFPAFNRRERVPAREPGWQ